MTTVPQTLPTMTPISHETYWFAVGYAKGCGVVDTPKPFTPHGETAHDDGERLAHADRLTIPNARYSTNVLRGCVRTTQP